MKVKTTADITYKNKFAKRLRDLPIRFKILLIYAILFTLAISLESIVIYSFVRSTVEAGIKSELKNSTALMVNMVKTAANLSIRNHLRVSAMSSRETVARMYQQSRNGLMTEAEAQAMAGAVLTSQAIGESGYTYCLNSQGIIKVHPKAALLGTDISGHAFVQEQIKKKEGYLEYDWRNPDEPHDRPKALYMTYFEPWDWIISASSYRDEFNTLVNVNDFRDSILAIHFGETGYPYVIKSDGTMIIHPQLEGRNMLNVKNDIMRSYARKVCEQKRGEISYVWQNPDEPELRRKLAVFDYIPELDWIIAASGYHEEFYSVLRTIRYIVFLTVPATLFLVLLLTLWISRAITHPLENLRNRFDAFADGDLNVRLAAESDDEVVQLTHYFNDFMNKLEKSDKSLRIEINERRRVEAELLENQELLENRVQQRTAELTESKRKLKYIIDFLPDATFVIDRDSKVIAWNRAIEEMTGIKAEDMLGKGDYEYAKPFWGRRRPILIDLVHLSQEELEKKKYASIKLKDKTLIGESYAPNIKNGGVYFIGNAAVLYDSKGAFAGAIESIHDITERKRAEEALRESERKMANIINFLPDPAFVIDRAGKVIFWNHAIEEMTGAKADDMIGKDDYEYALPIYGERRPVLIDLVLAPQEKFERQYIGIERQGDKLYGGLFAPALPNGGLHLFASASALYNAKGEVTGAIEIIRDITERQQAEEAMLEAKEAAEAANLAKSAFLASMSHELRTPLNAILGFSELMTRDPNLTPHQHENLATIGRSGEHLLALINDVLDMAKIESGGMELQLEEFDLHYMLLGVEEMIHVRAEKKNLLLSFEPAPDVPQYIRADQGRLRQVLINLLGNAVKFTHEGEITLRISILEPQTTDAAPETRLFFEVEDTGAGIAAEEMDRLFEAFVQTETGRRSREGTGLGLPISRQFVQLMGGEMTAISQPGRGAVFRFDLAVDIVDAAVVKTQVRARRVIGLEPEQLRFRILIVDDKEDNRLLLNRLLKPLSFDVREACDGQEALDIWKEWSPHLIWMDMRMPVMDGEEATQQIKSTTKGQATAVIALTASVLDEERSVVLSAGCDDFVRKPFREAEIFDAMHKHIGVRYIYEELPENPEVTTDDDVLTPEALSGMPAHLLKRFHQAVINLDMELIESLADRFREQNAALADALEESASNFEYDRLTKSVEEALAMGTK
ncbi:cache domain-containing protein [Desulfococcaceae bacterium HSG9]|nr:cache domain-containing protein [Desulfococcaceae bacterium HSG9]